MTRTPFLLATVLLSVTAAAQGHWWVSPTGLDTDPGTEAQPFQTINFAASVAAPGDVIHLFAATYGDEQNHVQLGTKQLTIVGAGVGQTIIKAHSSTTLVLPAGTLTTPTSEAHRCCVTMLGNARVDLRDMTLDQGFSIPGTGRAYCLWVGGGADAECDNVEVVNARANPLSGLQGPTGINIRGDGVGDTCYVTLRNCNIHEWGKNGIVANYDAYLIMDGCTVEGSGPVGNGLPAQNCVQLSRGASGEIYRCTITNSWYDYLNWTATGMLLYDPGTVVVIEDCDFGNCQSAVYYYGSAPMTIAGTFARNHIAGSYWGFYTYQVSGLTVTGNSFGAIFAGANDDAWDDAGGNTYSGNYYSSLTAAGPYALPGTGAVSDPVARPFMAGFGTDTTTALPAGYWPVDLAAADFGGDAAPDFAALCQGSTPSLAVGINTGGTFAVTNLTFGAATGAPIALVTGEFDGNAGLDVAVVTASVPPTLTENKVYVFANNGAGAFSLLHTHLLAGATTPSGLAAGDLDGDGIADLAVSDSGSAGFIAGTAAALLNNGSGTGFVPVALAGGYTVACRDLAIGDFDGDTFADVAVTEGDTNNGSLHLFAGDGAGAFTAFASSPLGTALNPQQVLATDLEGDGDLDLAVSCTRDAFGLDAGGIDAFVNDGAGAFASALYFVDRGPTALAAGDFDRDSDPDSLRLDLAVANPIAGSVSVLGEWSEFGYGSGGIAASGVLPVGVAIADVTGDGFGDLIYADAGLGIVVVRPGVPQARVDSYGAGTAGTAGRVPNLYPVGAPALPTQPCPTFGLGLRNARPLSIAVIAVGLDPLPVAPGALLIDNIGATWILVTNVLGRSAVPMPFPANPLIYGFSVYCQAGVFDVNGSEAFYPGLALSNGLKIRIGQ